MVSLSVPEELHERSGKKKKLRVVSVTDKP
jgi:hypothetical protein